MFGFWDVYCYCMCVYNQFFLGRFIIYLLIIIYLFYYLFINFYLSHLSFIYYLSCSIFCLWLVLKTNIELDALDARQCIQPGFVIK